MIYIYIYVTYITHITYNVGYESDERINVEVAFSEASTLDRIVFARAYGRRAACTAQHCRVKSCKILSLSVSGYCYQHAKSSFVKEMMDKQAAATEEQQPEGVKLIRFIRGELEKDSKTDVLVYKELPVKQQDIADVKAIFLTEKAANLASKVDYEINPANLAKAKSLLAGHATALALEDVEIAQLYDQFQRLDIEKNGTIDVDDLRVLIARINPKFNTYSEELKTTHVADVLHSVSFGKTVIDSISFPIYVNELLLHREREKDPNLPREFLQTPFWDLRQAILFQPATNTSNTGWMLKKRNRLSSVTWSKRYFRFSMTKSEIVKESETPTVPEECLEFWELPTNVDPSFIDSEEVHLKGKPVLKGILLLSCIIGVHFDSLIQLPENTLLDPYEYVGFRVNLRHARSYVFVTDKEQAIEWVAKLSHYANANKLKDEWVADWSLHETEETVTTRDLMYAAAAIVKLGCIKKALLKKDLILAIPKDKMSDEDKAKQIRALAMKAKQFEHQTYDTEALAICGITDQHTLDQAGGIVLTAMGLFEASKMQLKMFDNSVCMGAFGYTYLAIVTALKIDAYIKDVRFNLKTRKFQVSFDQKFMIRRCSNQSCIYLFKTVSFNVEYKKHHCRACGLVVCHACSTTRLYFEGTKSFERVCDMCISRRGPPEERLLNNNSNSAKSPDKGKTASPPQSPTTKAAGKSNKVNPFGGGDANEAVETVTRSSIMRPSMNAATLLAMQPKIKAVQKGKRSSIGDIKVCVVVNEIIIINETVIIIDSY